MVLVRLPLPAGYDPSKTDVYYISTETGVIERMNSYAEDGYIYFETNHFSVYAVLTASEDAPSQPEGENGGLSFFAKIMKFFRDIADWFKRLLGR